MAFPKLLQRLFQNNGAGDKLNKAIVPDLDYLPKSGGTIDGSVTINGTTVPVSDSIETYKEGIKFGWGSEISQSRPNGLDIWGKRGDATTVVVLYGEKKEGDTLDRTPGIYLRAGDGTNTKSMSLSAKKGLTAAVCELRRSAGQKELIIGGDDNDGCIQLFPGAAGTFVSKKSASLFLTSTDYTSNTVKKGSFCLSAMDATTGAKTLVGSPDGSLTWCGKSLTGGLTVVAESYSANSWYRKYSDGWIEQGGQASFAVGYNATVSASFPTAFTNAASVFCLMDAITGSYTNRTGFLSFSSYNRVNSGGDGDNTTIYQGNASLSITATGITAKGGKNINWEKPTFSIRYFVCGK